MTPEYAEAQTYVTLAHEFGYQKSLIRTLKPSKEEFGLHLKLTAINCPYILRCFGSSVRERVSAPHLGYGYLEYAPWGDMFDMMDRLQ
jgi:hypothetical protein